MVILLIIAFGIGLICCAGTAAPAVLLALAVRRSSPKAAVLRVLVYGYAILAAISAAYWCAQILKTSWLLVSKDGGPGPFGLLMFPFWAAIGALPALLGIGILNFTARSNHA